MADTVAEGRVRKRTSNACTRCRRQKIKCSGNVPCEQCSKRNLPCAFESGHQKVSVSKDYIANLQRQAARSASYIQNHGEQQWPTSPYGGNSSHEHNGFQGYDGDRRQSAGSATPSSVAGIDNQQPSEVEEHDPDAGEAAADEPLVNPLAPGESPAWTTDVQGRPVYLGATSNWSFGRRVLGMVHEKVTGTPLPVSSLLFEGSTYDVGWDGRRDDLGLESFALPTPDFAMFLINAVKFQCGQLYHLFDEKTFMAEFNKFHEAGSDPHQCHILWYIHYLLILAFGKAFIVRVEKGRRPPGSDLFTQAMKMLPDTTFLCANSIQSIEVLCSAALYLQCLDSRGAAYNLIGQAMRIAIENGMHTDMPSQFVARHTIQRCREAWWTVYILDRQMTSLMGVPLMLHDDDITARIPSYTDSAQKSVALNIQIKISKATAVIQQTVYRRDGRKKEQFLPSIKEALKIIASANDERNQSFPLDLQNSRGVGIPRLSAYLHLFHHQCIILATRPLLFSYWQRRLTSPTPLRVTSQGGARSLLRVCVGSAQQSLNILERLQSQSLLESFLPFDLDATFSSAVVLSLAAAVDPSLLRNKGPFLETVYVLLDEMVSRGNLIAKFHKAEIQQLDENIKLLPVASENSSNASQRGQQESPYQTNVVSNNGIVVPMQTHDSVSMGSDYLGDWYSDDGLTGEQLMALADSLDFEQLDWMNADAFQPIDPMLQQQMM